MSLDGGGLRGVIPAVLLKRIEKELNARTAEIFDCLAGTSTGAIIATGLSVSDDDNSSVPRYSAAYVLELYKTLGKKIFASPSWLRKATTGYGLFGPKYSGRAKKEALDSLLGNLKMGQVFSQNLVIPRVNMTTNELEVCQKEENKNLRLSTILNGATAAPSYFPPEQDNGEVFVDAGIDVNNPTSIAVAETIKKIGNMQRDIFVLSLGTGYSPRPPLGAESKNWGLLGCARNLIPRMMDGNAQLEHIELDALAKDPRFHYVRIEPQLPSDLFAMDKPENIPALEAFAENLADKFFESNEGKQLISLLEKYVVGNSDV